MAKNKIAEFVADLEVKVKNLKGLNDLSNKLDDLPKKFKKAADSMGASQKSLGNAVGEATSAVGKQRKELEKSTKAFWDNVEAQKNLAAVAAKAKKISNKWNSKQIVRARTRQQASGLGGMLGNQTGFKRLAVVEQYAKGVASSKLANTMREIALNEKLSSDEAKSSAKSKALVDRLHGQALREDARRTRAAQNLARIQDNVARREQLMAERTAAIREAGAKRAAAIIQAAELKAQAMAARAAGGGTGGSRRGFSVMGGATVGGALGTATSNLSGILPGIGGGWALANVNRKSQEIIAAENSIRALAPTLGEANIILRNIQKLGSEMGGSYSDMTKQFASVYASTRSNIGSGATVDMFRGILKYGNVLGMDDEAMKGSLRAVSQMFSKDRITAEEARSQLAERMPAAMQMLADVVSGGDTKKLDKMMSSGELDPKVIMPLFGKLAEDISEQNDAYAKSLKTSITAQRRMNYEWEMFIKLFSEAGGEQGFARIFNTIAKFMKDNPNLAKGLAEGVDKIGAALEWVNNTLTNLSLAFSDFAKVLGMSGAELALLIGGVMFLSTGFGALVGIITAVALVIEDLYVSLNGGDGLFRRFYDSLSPENQEKIKGVGESLGKLRDAFNELFSAFSKLDIKPLAPLFESAFGGVAEIIQSHIDRLTTLVRLMAKITSGDWSGAAEIVVGDVQKRFIGAGQAVLSVLPDDLMGGDMRHGSYSSGMTYEQMMQSNKLRKGVSGFTGNTTFGDINIKLELSGVDPEMLNQQLGKSMADEFISAVKNFTSNE